MRLVDCVRTNAHLTDEVTDLEKRNRTVSRKAAEEAIVLLENDGTLPVGNSATLALYGSGVTNTIKGGSGSGEVNERHSVSIFEGIEQAGYEIVNEDMLRQYRHAAASHREQYFRLQQKKAGLMNFTVTMANLKEPYCCPQFPLLKENDLQPADICIYVISRISGESYDRKLEKGDYYLSDVENDNLHLCAEYYRKVILLINTGGPIDLNAVADINFAGVLFLSMLGTDGGTAVAEVLSGTITPSGHLTDTWVNKYSDIPGGMEYSYLNGNLEKEFYKEDIYVGYRYFDSYDIPVKYPFGYGKSYTTFSIALKESKKTDEKHWKLEALVKNTGAYAGKSVVQVYIHCAGEKLKKENRKLVGFSKTKELEIQEEQTVSIEFGFSELASFWEEQNGYLVEKGWYDIYMGENIRDSIKVTSFEIETDLFEPIEKKVRLQEEKINLLLQNPEIKCVLNQMKPEDLADIVVGCGNDMMNPVEHYYTVPGCAGYTTNKYFECGITDISFCDGPAGIRFQQQAVAVNGKNITKAITSSIETLYYLPKILRKRAFGKKEDGVLLYQFTTAFPVGTALGQTWNTILVETVGKAVNTELEEYGICFWLAPGLNIHRNPLCGRNYEYYSEDPFLSGKIAAAMTRGVQYQGSHYVALKHFICNNQEANRQKVSSEVSNRAMREIYLRGFEIAVKEGQARGVMTAYNKINGTYNAACYETITEILRNEWGFDGLVMTDWDNAKKGCSGVQALQAGVDLQMAGSKKQIRQIKRAIKQEKIAPDLIRISAARVLNMIFEYRSKEDEKCDIQ